MSIDAKKPDLAKLPRATLVTMMRQADSDYARARQRLQRVERLIEGLFDCCEGRDWACESCFARARREYRDRMLMEVPF
jgi:hypothetical protein